MSFDAELFRNGFELWGAALLRASVQGGLAALVVAALCRLLPAISARFQCWLWRLVVVKFLVALVVVVPIPLPFDLPFAAPIRSVSPPQAIAPLAAVDSASGAMSALPSDSAVLTAASALPSISLLSVLFVGWAIVAAWQLARIVAACRNAHRLRSRCRVSDDRRLVEPLVRYSRLAGLVRPPSVLESEGEGSPLVVGIFRPAIVLPTTTLARLTDTERALVLGHELAHIGRRDLFCSLVASVVRALFFFHPLAWLSHRRLALAQEIAADEMAIAMQNQSPIDYASLLLSVVGKLGPACDRRAAAPLMSVGAADNRRSLEQRLTAMRFFGRESNRLPTAYGFLLTLCAVITAVPWTLTASSAEEKERVVNISPDRTKSEKQSDRREQKTSVPKVKSTDPKSKMHWGRFVSAKDGMLTLQTSSGDLIESKIFRTLKTTVWSDAADKFVPTDAVAALRQIKVGTAVFVSGTDRNGTLRIGARKRITSGSLVSFEDDRLRILHVNPKQGSTKKDDGVVRFNKFRDDVPAYERIDGGEYRAVGPADDVLRRLKKGTMLHVHSEGDDNVTLIQIGEPKKS